MWNASAHRFPIHCSNPLQYKEYDSYSPNVVVPDHFVAGLFELLLRFCFYGNQEASEADLLELSPKLGLNKIRMEGLDKV